MKDRRIQFSMPKAIRAICLCLALLLSGSPSVGLAFNRGPQLGPQFGPGNANLATGGRLPDRNQGFFGPLANIAGTLGNAALSQFAQFTPGQQCPLGLAFAGPADIYRGCGKLPVSPPDLSEVCQPGSLPPGRTLNDLQTIRAVEYESNLFSSSCLDRWVIEYEALGRRDASEEVGVRGARCMQRAHDELLSEFQLVVDQLQTIKNFMEKGIQEFLQQINGDGCRQNPLSLEAILRGQGPEDCELYKLQQLKAALDAGGPGFDSESLDPSQLTALRSLGDMLKVRGSACNATLSGNIKDGNNGLNTIFNSFATGDDSLFDRATNSDPNLYEKEVNAIIANLRDKERGLRVITDPGYLRDKILPRARFFRDKIENEIRAFVERTQGTYQKKIREVVRAGVTLPEQIDEFTLGRVQLVLRFKEQLIGQSINACVKNALSSSIERIQINDAEKAFSDTRSAINQYILAIRRAMQEAKTPQDLVARVSKVESEKNPDGKLITKPGVDVDKIGPTSKGVSFGQLLITQISSCEGQTRNFDFADATNSGQAAVTNAAQAEAALREIASISTDFTENMVEQFELKILRCGVEKPEKVENTININNGICRNKETYNPESVNYCIPHAKRCIPQVEQCKRRIDRMRDGITLQQTQVAEQLNGRIKAIKNDFQALVDGYTRELTRLGRNIHRRFNGRPNALFQLPKGQGNNLLVGFDAETFSQELGVRIKGGDIQGIANLLQKGADSIGSLQQALVAQMGRIQAEGTAEIQETSQTMLAAAGKLKQVQLRCRALSAQAKQSIVEIQSIENQRLQEAQIAADNFCSAASSVSVAGCGNEQRLSEMAVKAAGQLNPAFVQSFLNELRAHCSFLLETSEAKDEDFTDRATDLCNQAELESGDNLNGEQDIKVIEKLTKRAKARLPTIAKSLFLTAGVQVPAFELEGYIDRGELPSSVTDLDAFEELLQRSNTGQYLIKLKFLNLQKNTTRPPSMCHDPSTGYSSVNDCVNKQLALKKAQKRQDLKEIATALNKNTGNSSSGTALKIDGDALEVDENRVQRYCRNLLKSQKTNTSVLLAYENGINGEDAVEYISDLGMRSAVSCQAQYNQFYDQGMLPNVFQGAGRGLAEFGGRL